MPSPNQPVVLPILTDKKVRLFLKREDLLHPHVSGNKYRKLKYNIIAAKEAGYATVLTFGGAFSNHIAATAYAASEAGLKSIGVIRGEELATKWNENATLKKAYKDGMRFKFVSRETYREKEDINFIATLHQEYEDFYTIPEGGTNALAIKGCEEILNTNDTLFDFVCCSVGTGGTIAGLINSCLPHQQIIGFPALKGDFLQEEISKWVCHRRWHLETKYHFGGYGNINTELVHFINEFKKNTQIPLDPIYTGKMLYGLLDMVQQDTFAPGAKILAIHTGGLQGVQGMNSVLKKKKLPLLTI